MPINYKCKWKIWLNEHSKEDRIQLWKNNWTPGQLYVGFGYGSPNRGASVFNEIYDYCSIVLKMELKWWLERNTYFNGNSIPKWVEHIRFKTTEQIRKIWEENIYNKDLLLTFGYNEENRAVKCTERFMKFCEEYLKMDLKWWLERKKKNIKIQRRELVDKIHKANKKDNNKIEYICRNINTKGERRYNKDHNKALTKYILDSGIMEHKCDWCKKKHGAFIPAPNGDKMYNSKGKLVVTIIQLDHENGNHYDNLLIVDSKGNILKKNVRFLCIACHGNTHSYGGKNRKKSWIWEKKTIIVDGEEKIYYESHIEE